MWDRIRRFRRSKTTDLRELTNSQLGKEGERLAVEYLEKEKFRIVVTNFLAPIGFSPNGRAISGEIDIIAYDESITPFSLSFIEVKTRRSADIAAPEAAVDRRKRRRIIRASRIYRRILQINEEPYRFDVLTIVLNADSQPHIELLRDYFKD